jgi:hypothetical protein
MKLTWRATVLVVALLGTSVFLAPGVAAQKGVFGLFPAGTYTLSFTGADFSASANNVEIFLGVSAGTETARPDGAPRTTTSETQVFLSLFDNNTVTFTFACLVLDHPSDFTIDNRLGSAALHTVLTPSTPTCPYSTPLSSNLAIDATWTGVGPLAKTTGVSDYGCAGYSAQSIGRSLINTATANLTVTDGATTTAFPPTETVLNSNQSEVAAHGSIDPGCGPTGAGLGPTPAGHYRFNGLFANGYFVPPTGGFNQVSLIESNPSAQPVDLSMSFFGGSIYGAGCFAIPQSDVASNGLISASVQTTITASSPLCTDTYPGYGLDFPLTVNATWTAIGPLMTLHDQNNYQCLGYTQSTATFVQNTGASSTATVTMPDYFGNPETLALSGGFGSLTQVSQSIQANGELPAACLVRA